MKYTNTIFNQLLAFLPKSQFQQFVGQHKGDRYVKKLDTWNQLNLLLYAQATGKESLREIETGLRMHQHKWYHLGVKTVARSTLSEALSRRDYQIYEKLFYSLLQKCRDLSGERNFTFKNQLYSLDASTIQLCLSLFDWAKYRTTKGALKLHTLLDNRTGIPECLLITDGKTGDITAAKSMSLNLEKDSIIVFDRAYIDYAWWQKLNDQGLFFVSRAKKNTNTFVLGQHNYPLEKGVLADEKIIFGDYNELINERYTAPLRRLRFWDDDTKKEYIFLTNNMVLSARTIADIYKDRWQIELFFKWIKQNLKIKTFLGTSKNAVMSQIWVAMIYYLLLAYIKSQTRFRGSLLELTRMLRETLMFRQNLIDLLSLNLVSLSKIQKFEEPQLAFF